MSKRAASPTIETNSKRNKSEHMTHFIHEVPENNKDTCFLHLEHVQDVFKNDRFSETVDLCDSAMDRILHQQLKILDIRAASLGMMGNFKKADKDASLMVHLAPSQSIGYIRMGDLWMLRGNQRQAMEVYQSGLKHIKEEETKGHELLLLRHQKAMQKRNEPFDIIAHLPYDIINLILLQLTLGERFQFLDTSKTWRNKGCACAPAWDHIWILNGHESAERFVQLLPYIDQHIIELAGIDLDQSLLDTLFRQLSNGQFNRLRRCYMAGKEIQNTHFDAFTKAGKTLTELHLSFEDISTVGLKRALHACTELRNLSINRGCNSIVMDIVHHNCQKLKRLSYGIEFLNTYDIYDDEIKTEKKEKTVVSAAATVTQSGLQELAVEIKRPLDIVPTLNQHHSTIRSLSMKAIDSSVSDGIVFYDISFLIGTFKFELEEANEKDLDTLAKACRSLRELRSIHLYAGDIACKTFIPPLLQNAIHLRWLSLSSGCFVNLPAETYTVIGNLPYLQRLTIDRAATTDEKMKTLFDALVSKDRQLPTVLEDIRVIESKSFRVDSVIDHLVQLPALKHLSFNNARLSEQDMLNLAKKLQYHPRFCSITLEDMNSVKDKTLIALAAIKQLKQIHLEDLLFISSEGLKAFKGTSIKLTVKKGYHDINEKDL
ncbi:hypothetical protein BDA99DRAFT_576263 [Phascolomyces articulosus]|uniref:F-box domain-containing protein n=1 Tax=Phascolomyces articulosus TaxID=60185 RepID=A0AAD5K034_9FUNG|nr:hypothetical protein BDA99DRAFT_576263 [Phascolomyces articulosus]